jgi:hypothetical protein
MTPDEKADALQRQLGDLIDHYNGAISRITQRILSLEDAIKKIEEGLTKPDTS